MTNFFYSNLKKFEGNLLNASSDDGEDILGLATYNVWRARCEVEV